jgi:hypothetical protein
MFNGLRASGNSEIIAPAPNTDEAAAEARRWWWHHEDGIVERERETQNKKAEIQKKSFARKTASMELF